MLSSQLKLSLSYYSDLYDMIVPKDHILRKIRELVDFSFIYDELKNKYCLDNGRNEKTPILLFKYLLLKYLYTNWLLPLLWNHGQYRKYNGIPI